MKLRTLLIAAAMAWLTALGATAQRTYSPNFSVGAKGGITEGLMGWSPTVRQGLRQGLTFGVMARYTEERTFGLIAELNFTQRGWQENYPFNPEFSYGRTFSYIQLPLLTHIRFGSQRFKGFVNLGPEVGYMFASSISSNFNYGDLASVDGYPSNRRTEQLTLPIHSRFDYGIAAGLGGEFFFNKRHSIMLEARYYFGLANVFSAKRGDTFGASRTMAIEATVGYFFRIK
jgi:hypothetical protein